MTDQEPLLVQITDPHDPLLRRKVDVFLSDLSLDQLCEVTRKRDDQSKKVLQRLKDSFAKTRPREVIE